MEPPRRLEPTMSDFTLPAGLEVWTNGAIRCLDCGRWEHYHRGGIKHSSRCDTGTLQAAAVRAPAPVVEAAEAPAKAAPAGRSMAARFAGRCQCGARVKKGDPIRYADKVVGCPACDQGAGGYHGLAADAKAGGASLHTEAEIRDAVDGGWISGSDAMNRDY